MVWKGHVAWAHGRVKKQPAISPMEQAHGQADAQALPQSDSPPPPGYGQPQMYHQVQPRSAALGVVASFFIPGLGSMLNDKVGKDVGILVCYFVSWIVAIASPSSVDP